MSNQGFRVIDSHTAGEPTRTIVDCELHLPASTMDERLAILRSDFDHLRRAIVREPRGSEVMVGAHLLPPIHPDHTAAVVFFNNVGYLGMCGHGMIGVIETLRFLGRIEPGIQTIETVAGLVKAELLPDHSVRIQNVPSYRVAKDAPIATKSFGTIPCDIAYGGNWFCLAKPDAMKNLETPVSELMTLAQELMQACREPFPEVDHVELVGPPRHPTSNARNFVLCPGAMYDRSPCGTGTSAKLACLAADGELLVGQRWIQEGVLGTRFEGTFQWYDSECGKIIPTVRGQAFVNGDLRVLVDPEDPFAWGM
ncbi:proline racemase family protein [Pirellulaceae bacterium SH467]|jgi:proline racemase